MRQLALPFDDEGVESAKFADSARPSAAELAILAELEIERLVGNFPTSEDRQRLFARLAAEERRRVVDSRRGVKS